MPKPVGRQVVDWAINVENEQLILAAMMHYKTTLRDLSLVLSTSEFLGPRHKVIFSVLQQLAFRHLEYDADTFVMIAGKRDYGARRYLKKLYQAFPRKPKNIEAHVEILRLEAVKYSLRTGPIQELTDCLEDPTVDMDQLSGLIQELVRGASGHVSHSTHRGRALYERYLADMKARRKSSSFVPTGYQGLDEDLTEGLARRKISIWTARPSIGKSTFVWNIADKVANTYGIKTGYFALEMDEISVLDGVVAARTRISLDELIKDPKGLSKKKLTRVHDAIESITENENLIFWEKSLNIEKFSRVLAEDNFGVVFIDLYEKMIPGEKTASVIDAHLDLMQALAKEFDVHIALVHQTRRGVEKRKNKRPTMEDLKNSGKYEEVADLIIALYREKYYDSDCPGDVLEVGILKQRRGARLGWNYFEFEGKYGRVGEEVRDWEDTMYPDDGGLD